MADLPYPDRHARATFQDKLKRGQINVFRQTVCGLCEEPAPKGFKFCSQGCHDAYTFAEQLAGEYDGNEQEE